MKSALERLAWLSGDSQYDLACSCATPKDGHRVRCAETGSWLYPVPLLGGRRGILMRTLLSNCCSSDCKYCPLRHDGVSDHRCSLTPDEVASLFMEQDRKFHLYGLFLSSGIIGSADHTMELLTGAAEILRKKHQYRGYIHLKVIPGASDAAMDKAFSLASCVSLNVETPGAQFFRQLSSYKDFDTDIVHPLKYMAEHMRRHSAHGKVRCTSQFIVGAATENDTDILRYMDGFYNRLRFDRLYFSAYQKPSDGVFRLDNGEAGLRLDREHRLYQADFLLRKYGFSADEIPCGADGRLDLRRDPKQVWADLHPAFYPVDVNTADRESLLRVPGIGPVAADRILHLRKIHRFREVAELGLPGKTARKTYRYVTFG